MLNNSTHKQPWLYKPIIEFVFILLPPFACLLLIALLPQYFQNNAEMTDYSWVILVLLIDVAHVYSTLYRTYFDNEMQQKQRTLLYAIPLISFLFAVMVYNISSFLFWRVMAYVAVFHFIRQQYGFMRLYSRLEQNNKWQVLIDKITIYYATIYPIIFWHLHGSRNFNWFIKGDFYFFSNNNILSTSTFLYYIILLVFVMKELLLFVKTKKINLPKLLIIIGTILSWYFGIVYYNGDMAFTILNIVSHGIPYMALIWMFAQKKHNSQPNNSSKILKRIFSKYGIVVFIGIIFLLAYIEEGLWDGFVWKEHNRIFHLFSQPFIQPSHQVLSFIVPLLALPQITHYIIDGFIWKTQPKNTSQ
jgi:hypothetical protein